MGDSGDEQNSFTGWSGRERAFGSFVLPAESLPDCDRDAHGAALYVHGTHPSSSHDNPASFGETSPNDTDTDDVVEPLLSPQAGGHPPPTWRTLMLFRALYFLSGISGSTWGRFSTVFYTAKGLSASQIGAIEGVMPIVTGAIQPLWGVVADYSGSRKAVYCFCRAVSTAILMLLAWPSLAQGFERLFLISLGMSVFVAPGVVDAHVLEVLGNTSKKMYGRLRLWTAVSWGAGSFAMGIVSDRLGFEYNFAAYLAFTVLSLLIVGVCIPDRHNGGGGGEAGVEFGRLWKKLSSAEVLVFFLEVLLFGMAMGVIERGLLFIFVLKDLKGSTTMCGAIVGVTVLFELPIFHYSGVILDKIGHSNALLCSFLSYVGRVWGYTLLTPETIHWIFALEMVHGVTFALMWVAVVEKSRLLTPNGWGTTFQSLLGGTYSMLGQGLGAAIGGLVMEEYGAILLFRGCSIMVAVLFLVRAACTVVIKCCLRKPQAPINDV